jgi:hypothetical protein
MADPSDRSDERTAGHADAPRLHEPSDVSARGVLWFVASLVAFALVVHLVLAWLYWIFAAREERQKASAYPLAQEQRKKGVPLPPPPRLDNIEPRRPVKREVGHGTPPPQIFPDPSDFDEQAIERARKEGVLRARPEKERQSPWGAPSDASSARRPWGGMR